MTIREEIEDLVSIIYALCLPWIILKHIYKTINEKLSINK